MKLLPFSLLLLLILPATAFNNPTPPREVLFAQTMISGRWHRTLENMNGQQKRDGRIPSNPTQCNAI